MRKYYLQVPVSTYLLIGGDRVVSSLVQQPLPKTAVWPRVRNAHCALRGRSIASLRAVMQCRAIYVQLFHELFRLTGE